MQRLPRILVVDDEARFRENLVRALHIEGFEAEGAENGFRALEKLMQNPFDVVLLDMKMPELSGEDTLFCIRERDLDCAVICLSGHVSLDDATAMIRQGAFDYLIKPASLEEIVEKVRLAHERRLVEKGEADASDIAPGTI